MSGTADPPWNCFSLVLGALGLAMWLPLLAALYHGEPLMVRAFLTGSAFSLFSAAAIQLVLGRRLADEDGLIPVFAALWLAGPIAASVPFGIALPHLGEIGAWFEALSALTTTGADLHGTPDSMPKSLSLWRYLCAFAGGLGTLTLAYVALSPACGLRHAWFDRPVRSVSPFVKALLTIAPLWVAINGTLAFLLRMNGLPLFDSVCLAISALSSTGYVPRSGGLSAYGGDLFRIELLLAFAMPLAMLGAWFWAKPTLISQRRWRAEIAALRFLLIASVVILSLSHPLGPERRVIWAALFSSLSWLSTTGFDYPAPELLVRWPGAETILPALAFVGGGIASAAGGIKLLRLWALRARGAQELTELVFPHGVFEIRGLSPRLHCAAQGAWVVVALNALGLVALTGLLTLTGETLRVSALGALASMVNVGPALDMLAPGAGGFATFNDGGQLALGVAMIIGRADLIALAAIARQRTA